MVGSREGGRRAAQRPPRGSRELGSRLSASQTHLAHAGAPSRSSEEEDQTDALQSEGREGAAPRLQAGTGPCAEEEAECRAIAIKRALFEAQVERSGFYKRIKKMEKDLLEWEQ